MLYVGYAYIEITFLPKCTLFIRRRKNLPRYYGPMRIKQRNIALAIHNNRLIGW